MRPIPKTVLSWLVVMLGCFVGLFALAGFGAWWLPLGDRDSGWFLRWIAFAGVGLFGVGFLVGSITAPRWTSVLVPHLLAYSAPFLLFGLFWLGTHKLAWPTLLRHRPRTMARRIAALDVTCLVVLCLDVAVTLGRSALTSSLFSGDCR